MKAKTKSIQLDCQDKLKNKLGDSPCNGAPARWICAKKGGPRNKEDRASQGWHVGDNTDTTISVKRHGDS